jgi:hypothetical protein
MEDADGRCGRNAEDTRTHWQKLLYLPHSRRDIILYQSFIYVVQRRKSWSPDTHPAIYFLCRVFPPPHCSRIQETQTLYVNRTNTEYSIHTWINKLICNLNVSLFNYWSQRLRRMRRVRSWTVPTLGSLTFWKMSCMLRPWPQMRQRFLFRIRGPHSRGYEEFCLLGYKRRVVRWKSIDVRRNIPPPSSGSKNKPSKKPPWSS